jgi:predicted DsbA family dithiol-disulfide isomerase
MKIEIWSDVMCPWCYIGKRRFEKALSQFANRDKIEIEWKSFQLNPSMKTDPGKSINQYLVEIKGWTLDKAKQAHEHVTQLAKAEGLNYNFDKVIVANSFDAHRLLQLAKKNGIGNEMEERLFKAYFEEGKNIADYNTLIGLGTDVRLDKEEVKQMLMNETFADEVRKDAQEANEIGCTGVPFFVLNRKYGISGAQEPATFLKALERAFEEVQL